MSVDRERAQQILDEAEYWRAILADVTGLHETLGPIADSVANATVALVTLVNAPPSMAHEFVSDGLGATSAAMKGLLAMQKQLGELLRICDGRAQALTAEIDAA